MGSFLLSLQTERTHDGLLHPGSTQRPPLVLPFSDLPIFHHTQEIQIGTVPTERDPLLPENRSMNDVARYPVLSLSSSMASQQGQQAAHPQKQKQQCAKGIWSTDEHDRFLDALKKYPLGPWKTITDHIGSRSIRQVQTHAQKYQEKVLRRLNGSSKAKVLRLRQEHRIDHDVLDSQTLIGTPGERRKNARKASRAKLSASLSSSSASAGARADSLDLEPDDEDDGDVLEEDPDLFRISLSEFYDEEDLVKLKTEADAEDDEGDADLPSLSECLDFFITCFSNSHH